MTSRAFNLAIVLFWLTAMSWLVVAKILPPLQVGEPPDYDAILGGDVPQAPVCWLIQYDNHAFGWAASKIDRRDDGLSEIYNRVFFSQLPLDQMAPGWLGALVRPVLKNASTLDMDTKSRLVIDPLGRLVDFNSKVRLGSIRNAVSIRGLAEGRNLKLHVQSGELRFETEKYLPPDALVADELSPQSRLPGLRVGQKWTTPVFSPFRPLDSPMEILQASVERGESISWNGQSTNCRVVVYRNDAGSGLLATQEPRGRLWVDTEGLVLRQEIALFNAQLVFVRLPDAEAAMLGEALGEDWTTELPDRLGKELLGRLQSSNL